MWCSQPDWFNVRATVTYFSHDFNKPPWYNACPAPGCNKKVTEDAQGQFHCAKCNKSYAEYIPRYVCNSVIMNSSIDEMVWWCRYILNLLASDATGSQWLSCFNDQAEVCNPLQHVAYPGA